MKFYALSEQPALVAGAPAMGRPGTAWTFISWHEPMLLEIYLPSHLISAADFLCSRSKGAGGFRAFYDSVRILREEGRCRDMASCEENVRGMERGVSEHLMALVRSRHGFDAPRLIADSYHVGDRNSVKWELISRLKKARKEDRVFKRVILAKVSEVLTADEQMLAESLESEDPMAFESYMHARRGRQVDVRIDLAMVDSSSARELRALVQQGFRVSNAEWVYEDNFSYESHEEIVHGAVRYLCGVDMSAENRDAALLALEVGHIFPNTSNHPIAEKTLRDIVAGTFRPMSVADAREIVSSKTLVFGPFRGSKTMNVLRIPEE